MVESVISQYNGTKSEARKEIIRRSVQGLMGKLPPELQGSLMPLVVDNKVAEYKKVNPMPQPPMGADGKLVTVEANPHLYAEALFAQDDWKKGLAEVTTGEKVERSVMLPLKDGLIAYRAKPG